MVVFIFLFFVLFGVFFVFWFGCAVFGMVWLLVFVLGLVRSVPTPRIACGGMLSAARSGSGLVIRSFASKPFEEHLERACNLWTTRCPVYMLTGAVLEVGGAETWGARPWVISSGGRAE